MPQGRRAGRGCGSGGGRAAAVAHDGRHPGAAPALVRRGRDEPAAGRRRVGDRRSGAGMLASSEADLLVGWLAGLCAVCAAESYPQDEDSVRLLALALLTVPPSAPSWPRALRAVRALRAWLSPWIALQRRWPAWSTTPRHTADPLHSQQTTVSVCLEEVSAEEVVVHAGRARDVRPKRRLPVFPGAHTVPRLLASQLPGRQVTICGSSSWWPSALPRSA
jgi:hypothetical protein